MKRETKSRMVVAVLAMCTLALSACEKSRPDQYPDGTIDTPMLKTDATNAKIQITTGTQPAAETDSASLRADTEGTEVPVSGYKGPSQFAPMFKDLSIQAQPATTYHVRFALDRQYLTAYLEVPNPMDLTALQRELAAQFATEITSQEAGDGHDLMLIGADDQANTSVTRVPIFQYKIEGYGVVDHERNDLNEQTNDLRLDETNWPSANAIQISTRESDRQMVQLPVGDQDQHRIFVKDELNDKLFTEGDLQKELQIATSDKNPDTQFYSKVDGSAMTLYHVTPYRVPIDKSTGQASCSAEALQNTAAAQEGGIDICQAIQSGDPDTMARAGVLPCPDNARAALGPNPSSCYLIHAFQVTVTPVVAERTVNDDDATPDIKYEPAANPNSASLVRITLEPSTQDLLPPKQGDLEDPSKTLVVGKMQGEFLMTRTLTDSPSQFADTFTGNSAALEIVRFVFEKDRVRVVRSKPLVQRLGTDGLDDETLLTIPAKYYVLTSVAPNGTQLAAPAQQDADPSTPGAIALLDWTKDELPEANSPLTYYGLDQCFDKAAEPEVSDVRYNIDARQFSFSYTRSYQASNNPRKDCAGVYSYMYSHESVTVALPQTVFRFKERISFRAYNQADDQKVVLDMPFEAQKMLGFGMFTNRISVPDKYGDMDKVGTQRDLVSLWDLSGGKKITYVLAGLPPEGAPGVVTREDIIEAAREVIADLNKAFRQALAGSPLQRADGPAGDVIELKIEGEKGPDGAAQGELGDINRNTIYWVQKQFASTIIGLAQAQANPRSGLIETSNVYIYGGNLIGYLPYAREMAEAAKAYQDGYLSIDAKVQQQLSQIENSSSPESQASTSSQSGPSKSMSEISSAMKGIAQFSLFNPLATIATANEPVDFASVAAQIAANPELFSSGNGPANAASVLSSPSASSEFSDVKAFAQDIEAAQQNGAFASLDPQNALESVIDSNLGQIVGNLSPAGADYAQSMSARMALRKKIMDRFQSMGICAYDRAELDMTNSKVDTTKWADKEWVIRMFKPTLAHEIGHTLGLRHNFQGSYDKANWKFSPDEKTPREYSSIMDYMEDDHITYDGMGPQDVEALRAAYTGRIQLSDGSLVSLNDVLKASGADNWIDFTRLDPNTIRIKGEALKHYDFCTDEDTIGDPTCQQFDKGATPEEIVNHDILEYNAYYPLRNFPNDNLSLSLDTEGGYIASTFTRFLNIRKFLDELWYQLPILSQQQQALSQSDPAAAKNYFVNQFTPYFDAFFRGMWFFNSVIRTPDVDMPDAADVKRYTFDYQAVNAPAGKQIVTRLVERRAMQDVNVPDPDSDELQVRGILWDKIIATMMLTKQSFGFPRYLKKSESISYPEAEQIFLKHTSPMQLPTVELLSEMISGSVHPMIWSAGEPYFTGPSLVSATSNDLSAMRTVSYYGDLGAILNLDASSEVVSQNQDMSVLFRVLGTSGVPSGITSVLMPGTTGDGQGDLHYWSPSSGVVSDVVVRQANALAQLQKLAPQLNPLLAQWVVQKFASSFTLATAVQDNVSALSDNPAPAASPSPSASSSAASALGKTPLENQINTLLAQLPPEASLANPQGGFLPLTTDLLGAEIGDLLTRSGDLAQLQSSKGANSPDVQQLTLAYKNATQSDAMTVPAFGLLISLFNAGDDGSPALLKAPAAMQSFVSILPLDITEGLAVNNLKALDDLYVALHPDAIREYQ